MSEILVVGADSLIGAALYQELSNYGIDVIGTSRRHASPHKIYLNMLDNLDDWIVPRGITSAVICAGMTSIDYCEKEPNISRHINVIATKKIIDKLFFAGVHVVYPSSDLVTDKLMFDKQYSIQKLEMEVYLQNNFNKSCIVRMSKVIPAEFNLFMNWALDLQNSRTITPFLDKYFSPITLKFCTKILCEVINKEKYGLHILKGSETVSYHEAALELARKLNVNRNLIQPKLSFLGNASDSMRKVDFGNDEKFTLEIEPLHAKKIIIDSAKM